MTAPLKGCVDETEVCEGDRCFLVRERHIGLCLDDRWTSLWYSGEVQSDGLSDGLDLPYAGTDVSGRWKIHWEVRLELD